MITNARVGFGLIACAALILATPVGARAATTEELEKRLDAVEREVLDKDAEGQTAIDNKVAAAIDKALGGVEFHGMIDTTYFVAESVDPVTGNGTPCAQPSTYGDLPCGDPSDNNKLSTFNLNQVELRFSHASEWASFLAEVEFFQNPVNFVPGTGTIGDTNVVNLEQGWVAITPPSMPGLSVKMGKFNAPIGMESLDPDGRYSVTNSVVFNRLAPFNLTGLNVGYYGESFGIEGFLVNGWDADANGLNLDEDFSYGTKLGGAVGPLGLQFTYIGGKEDGTNDRHVLDGVATLTFDLSDDVTLFTGGEVNVGWEDNTDPQASNDKTWWGVISTTRLVCGAFGLTFRYDYAHIPDGFPGAPANEIKNLNLISYTGAASYDFTDNMIARLEYRYDQSEGPNPYILDDGRRVDDNNTFFAQFIYHW